MTPDAPTRERSVFLAAPFKALVDPETGVMAASEQAKLTRLIDFFEGRGFTVHNAHRRERWGAAFLAPDECTRLDFDEIAGSDLVVAIPGSPPSPGTHVELGWASALGKPLVLLLDKDREYAFLVRGLVALGNVWAIEDEDPTSRLDLLEALVDKVLENAADRRNVIGST